MSASDELAADAECQRLLVSLKRRCPDLFDDETLDMQRACEIPAQALDARHCLFHVVARHDDAARAKRFVVEPRLSALITQASEMPSARMPPK